MLAATREKPAHSNEDPTQPKISKFKKKKEFKKKKKVGKAVLGPCARVPGTPSPRAPRSNDGWEGTGLEH